MSGEVGHAALNGDCPSGIFKVQYNCEETDLKDLSENKFCNFWIFKLM